MKKLGIVAVMLLVFAFGLFLFLGKEDAPAPPQEPVQTPRETDVEPPAASPIAAKPDSTAPPAPALPVQEPTTGAVLTGIVKTDGGEPLAGAEVELYYVEQAAYHWQGEFFQRTTADHNGSFTFEGLKTGAAALRAALCPHMGFATPRISGSGTQQVEITAEAGGSIAGRVVNAQGEGIPGARLAPIDHDGERLTNIAMHLLLRAETDETGAFAFDCIPPETWAFHVSAEGYADTVSEAVDIGMDNVVIQMNHGGEVFGYVVKATDHASVEGVTVSAITKRAYALTKSSISGADGAFSISMMYPSTYSLVIDSDRWVLADVSPEVEVAEGQQTGPVVLTVSTGGLIRGRVEDKATGEPVAGAVVSVSGPVWRMSKSGDTGYYEVTGLTPGDYMLKFETLPAGYATVPGQRWERINLKAGQSLANVDFQVIKAVTITGTVVDSAGKPVVGARVSASTTNNLTRAATTSDDAGVFTLTRFAAGDSVYFTAASDAARLSEPITATIGPEGIPDLRLVLDSVTDASISGIVVDQNGGPIEAFVSAFGGDRKGGRTQSKGDGAFEINPLAAGHYELRLGRITDPMQTEVVAGSVDLAPGQHLRNLRLVYDISKSASISGHVMDAGGKPIESAVIYFGEASSVPVSSDGSYVIYDSPSEPLTINASADGYASQRRRNVAWGSTDVDFVLETLSPVTGEVRDAATKQLITRFRAGLGTIPPIVTPAWRDFNDPGGKFSLPPDSRSNSLFVQAEGYREVQLRLRSAGTEPVIVLMDRAVAVRGRVIDQTGAGVADAAIYLERLPRGIAAAPVATTDATGAFEIGLGGSESIYIYADHGGYSPGFTVASGGSSNVTIRLTPASSVSGIVTMDGAPVPDCHVALRHSDSMPMFGFSARTDTDGRFIIGQVPAGNLIVEGSMDVEDHYIAEGETPVTVPPGGSVETILELHLVDVDPEPAAE